MEAVRTGRARLIEWIEDIKNDAIFLSGVGSIPPEDWADRIMEDINRGIIAAEVDG